MTDKQGNIAAKRLLKAELKRAGVTYEALAERLGETHISIKSKVGRGTFSAAFFLAALKAIGRKTINIEDI